MHTELQNQNTFAKKDLVYKNYSVLTLCGHLHFCCNLVTEEERFLTCHIKPKLGWFDPSDNQPILGTHESPLLLFKK